VTSETLVALLDGEPVGRVTRDRQKRLTFTYDEAWQSSGAGYPLSLSMPLVVQVHKHGPIEAFLWGLLPDNEFILGKWAQRFQVSARDAFGLIANVGEDCAGAVQFVLPERLAELRAQRGPVIEWLDERAIGQRLRALREDHSAWRSPRDTGQFSLAGAQPKTALLLEGKRWGVPSGRTPTTHILKPLTGEFDGHVENEHFCLALASALGLPAAASSVRTFGDEVAIVVERYDRLRTRAGIRRLHQEDLCQALGVLPIAKYQAEGGPTPLQINEVIRQSSTRAGDDAATFADALALNWLIGGTDGHAKNYSLLLAPNQVRLALLYDLASALAYKEFPIQKLKLAMKIGGTYRLRAIGRSHWEKHARELGMDHEALLERIRDLARRLPDTAESVRKAMGEDGVKHPAIDRLSSALSHRANQCLRLLR
jgi:serine/threonine-protein kinase HipA